MKPLPTLKMLLLALIMADLGFSSAIAEPSGPAYGVATSQGPARGDARPTGKSSAGKSTHSLRKTHRHQGRAARKSRVHHRGQRGHQGRHKGAASQPKSTSQA